MMFDLSELAPTSRKKDLRWRDTSLTLIWLPEDGPIRTAHKIDDKLSMLTACGASDAILAVRQLRYPIRQEVLVVDDRRAACRILERNAEA